MGLPVRNRGRWASLSETEAEGTTGAHTEKTTGGKLDESDGRKSGLLAGLLFQAGVEFA